MSKPTHKEENGKDSHLSSGRKLRKFCTPLNSVLRHHLANTVSTAVTVLQNALVIQSSSSRRCLALNSNRNFVPRKSAGPSLAAIKSQLIPVHVSYCSRNSSSSVVA